MYHDLLLEPQAWSHCVCVCAARVRVSVYACHDLVLESGHRCVCVCLCVCQLQLTCTCVYMFEIVDVRMWV